VRVEVMAGDQRFSVSSIECRIASDVIGLHAKTASVNALRTASALRDAWHMKTEATSDLDAAPAGIDGPAGDAGHTGGWATPLPSGGPNHLGRRRLLL